jgi:dolichyl-phosphate-mannose--protein O-mannosyl transferase
MPDCIKVGKPGKEKEYQKHPFHELFSRGRLMSVMPTENHHAIDYTAPWWKRPLVWLILILSFAVFTRFYRLALPTNYVFDEVYHAVTARFHAVNNPWGYEWWHPAPEPNTAIDWLHPPLAKLTQAVSINIFGYTPYGWRFSSAFFGVLLVLAVYYLALQLTKVTWMGVFAAFFASLDGLLLVQSRIAMNDIHVTFFIVLTVIAYHKFLQSDTAPVQKDAQFSQISHRFHASRTTWLALSGLFAGLAASAKWSGVFVLGVMGFHYLFYMLKRIHTIRLSEYIRVFLSWVMLPPLVYVLSYTQFWLQGHTIQQFVELHKQIWHYQTTLTATHDYQSRPEQWMLDIRPVWMHIDGSKDSEGKVGNIYNLGNPVVFLAGLAAIVVIVPEIAQSRLKKKKEKLHLQTTKSEDLLLLLYAYIFVWVPWFASPRIMFFYHYTPAVPFLCIALGRKVQQMVTAPSKTDKAVGITIASLAFTWFFVFYPDLTGIPMPKPFVNNVYFFIKSWK